VKRATRRWIAVLALACGVFPLRQAKAIDQLGLLGEFSLPDRLRDLVDSQDDYYDAVQRLADASAAVLRARESAVKQAQSAPDYIAAVKAVDQTYQAYIEKKNAMVAQMERSDPVYMRMKSQAAAVDAQIESARQNPATTQEQFEELYKSRATFQAQWNQLQDDAMQRAGITPLRQAWIDATRKLTDLQAKLLSDVESNDRLKGVLAEEAAARAAVADARSAISNSPPSTDPRQSLAGDLLCKSSRTSFAGNDAWWTYGWTDLSAGKTTNPATGK
jgi:chromosome segregation ATPase